MDSTLDEDEEWMSTMDFVRSDIDPATVKPIAPRQLASLVNEFLIRSADILNEFCAKFENRMMELDIRLDTFERMLALMERKLENVHIDKTNKPTDVAKTADEGKTRADETEEAPRGTEERQNQRTEEQKGQREPTGGTVRAKEHPKVAKYFRMLKMGVPEAAVKQKMKSEGVDNAILNDPDKPMPWEDSGNREEISRRTSFPSEDDESSSTSDECN